MIAIDILQKYRENELNCAQTTACSLLHENEPGEEDTFLRAFSTLGNGVTATGTCGILLGSFAAMGKILSDQGLTQPEIDTAIEEIKNEFMERYGAFECPKLLGVKEGEMVDFTSNKVKRRCVPMIKSTTMEVQTLIDYHTNPLNPVMKRFNRI